MSALFLTRAEAEALRHRLDAADCIASAFADAPEFAHFPSEDVEAAAQRLSSRLASGEAIDARELTELEREVLIEAVEGSTWNAVHDADDVSPQRRASARRSLALAAHKLSVAFGVDALMVPEG